MSFLTARCGTFMPSRTVSLNAWTSWRAKQARTQPRLQHSLGGHDEQRMRMVTMAPGPEDRNTTHWLENRGAIPAVEISVDARTNGRAWNVRWRMLPTSPARRADIHPCCLPSHIRGDRRARARDGPCSKGVRVSAKGCQGPSWR